MWSAGGNLPSHRCSGIPSIKYTAHHLHGRSLLLTNDGEYINIIINLSGVRSTHTSRRGSWVAKQIARWFSNSSTCFLVSDSSHMKNAIWMPKLTSPLHNNLHGFGTMSIFNLPSHLRRFRSWIHVSQAPPSADVPAWNPHRNHSLLESLKGNNQVVTKHMGKKNWLNTQLMQKFPKLKRNTIICFENDVGARSDLLGREFHFPRSNFLQFFFRECHHRNVKNGATIVAGYVEPLRRLFGTNWMQMIRYAKGKLILFIDHSWCVSCYFASVSRKLKRRSFW